MKKPSSFYSSALQHLNHENTISNEFLRSGTVVKGVAAKVKEVETIIAEDLEEVEEDTVSVFGKVVEEEGDTNIMVTAIEAALVSNSDIIHTTNFRISLKNKCKN